MTQNLSDQLDQAADLANWIDEQFADVSFTADGERWLAFGCLRVAMAHFGSIVTLLRHQMATSAAVLLRSQIDAYVRGMWLGYAASLQEIDSFCEGNSPPGTGKLIGILETNGVLDSNSLSHTFSHSYGALSDYSHTGIRLVRKQYQENSLTCSFSTQEKLEILNRGEYWSMAAGISLAEMGEQPELAQRMLRRAFPKE